MPSFYIGFGPLARIRYRFRQRYLRRTYAGKPPKIYYDRRCQVYISPAKLSEDGDILWVCSELAGTSLLYEYCLGEQETHTHGFDGVLRDAYDYAETFSIPERCREQYSAQELDLLDKLVQRGRRDRGGGTV